MHQSPSTARFIYRWSAFLALPGGLWAAFEMYGLTLSGPQMLFFSIAHTMPLLVLAVFLSVPMGIAWLVQSAGALIFSAYRERLTVPVKSLAVFTLAISFHSAFLATYETWSAIQEVRVPLCLLGLVVTAFAVHQAWVWLRLPNPVQRVAINESGA